MNSVQTSFLASSEGSVAPHRHLQDTSSLWWLGVILIILGSLGNNLGNNLVSLAHKKQQEQDELDALNEELSAREASEATAAAAAAAAANDVEKGIVNELESNQSQKTTGPTAEKTTGGGGGGVMVVPVASDASLAATTPTKPGTVPNAVPKKKKMFPWRTIGTVVFVVGSLATFAAFGFAAQSLLASLESIQFVSNIFFVYFVHKEKVTWRMIVATMSIVGGNVMVVVFSDKAPALLTSAELINLYATNVSYWGYLVCAMVLWFINHFTYSHYYHARVVKKTLLWKHGFVEPFTFAVSSSIIGTQAVLNSKCMSMLIQVTSRGIVNEFERPHIWWILVTWIILVAYWLRRLDLGLAMFPPLFIIPVMQVFFVFFAILCGGIYFQEFLHFTSIMYAGFIIGVVLILAGVYGLAPDDMDIVDISEKLSRKNKSAASLAGPSTHGAEDESKKVCDALSTLALSGKDTAVTSSEDGSAKHVSAAKFDVYPGPAHAGAKGPAPAAGAQPVGPLRQLLVPSPTVDMARSNSELTESPTTTVMDSPMRIKPTPAPMQMSQAKMVVLSTPLDSTPLSGAAATVSSMGSTASSHGSIHTDLDDPARWQQPAAKGRRKIVKRGTTSIEQYADRHAGELPPLRMSRPGGAVSAPATPAPSQLAAVARPGGDVVVSTTPGGLR